MPISNTQLFSSSQKEYETQKIATLKRAEKKEIEGQEKYQNGQSKKRSKFWFMRMHQMKILYIFVAQHREILSLHSIL